MPTVGQTNERMPPTSRDQNDSTSSPPMMDEAKIAGSMHTEEPDGWDQAPFDIHNPRNKRHPRPDGIGGLIPAYEKGEGIIEKRA